jgi:Zn-dependent alcohol dehydrogenase
LERNEDEDPRRRCFCAENPLEIVEVDLEGPKAGEVLVEIMATGICHTDAYTLDGLIQKASFPRFWAMKARGSCAKWAQASPAWCRATM